MGKEAAEAAKRAYGESLTSCVKERAPEYSHLVPDSAQLSGIGGPHDSVMMGLMNVDHGLEKIVPGQLEDDGPGLLPQTVPYSGWCSAPVPAAWLAEKSDLVLEAFAVNDANGGHLTGGDVAIAHDQMNAVPLTERRSGFGNGSLHGLSTDLQERLLAAFLDKNNTSSDDSSSNKEFPGISEFNHICSDSYGPLKSNWTKLCPANLTTAQVEVM